MTTFIWLPPPAIAIIDQFRYIKIQSNTIELSTSLCGINPANSVVIPQSLVLRCIVLSSILMYQKLVHSSTQKHLSLEQGRKRRAGSVRAYASLLNRTISLWHLNFSKTRCYDIVHQERDVLPVVLMSSSSSESSPCSWSSSSSLLSVSLTSGWV